MVPRKPPLKIGHFTSNKPFSYTVSMENMAASLQSGDLFIIPHSFQTD